MSIIFDPLRFIADHAGMALVDAISEAYRQGQQDAQPEHLTDDDFETIRIHLSAYKEKLGNQHRWEEAEEYQRIINRFMAFASTQPEVIRCKDCKYWDSTGYCLYGSRLAWRGNYNDYCSCAKRREE